MIIECQTCHARFRLDESRIKGRGARVKCRKCGDSIVVLKEGASAPPTPAGDGFFDLGSAVRDSAGADLVILFVHAGMEYRLVPEPNVIQLFRGLVRYSGADAVIGHHPHVPPGMETVAGKPIVYSLGNFVFRQRTAWTNRGLWAALTYFPDRNYRLVLRPLVVGYTPSFAGGRDSAAAMARVDASSRLISRLPGVRLRRNVARP